jgi:hypothetical protein
MLNGAQRDALHTAANQLAQHTRAEIAPSAIDWTAIKAILAQILEALGPIIIQVILALLTRNNPTQN